MPPLLLISFATETTRNNVFLGRLLVALKRAGWLCSVLALKTASFSFADVVTLQNAQITENRH